MTPAPVRDALIGIIQVLMDDIDDLPDTCRAYTTAPSRWCDKHQDRPKRYDQLEAVDRKLWKARTDAEAIPLVAGLGEPEVTELLSARGHGGQSAQPLRRA
jgi:hypothetical protein